MPNTLKEALMHATVVDPANAQHIFALLRAEHAPPLVADDEEVVEWEQQPQPE